MKKTFKVEYNENPVSVLVGTSAMQLTGFFVPSPVARKRSGADAGQKPTING